MRDGANQTPLPRHKGAKTQRPPEGGLVYVLGKTHLIGAGEAIRTPDPNLGKVMLYP